MKTLMKGQEWTGWMAVWFVRKCFQQCYLDKNLAFMERFYPDNLILADHLYQLVCLGYFLFLFCF